MPQHRRTPAPSPARIRLATATAAAAALTGGLLVASVAPVSAATATERPATDFNGDGYADLVSTAPAATVGSASRAGAVVVLYGSASGVGTSHRKVISQNTSGVPGAAEKNDVFGDAVATGDFNRDGYTDLAVGARGEDVGSDADGGTVALVWGSASGLGSATTVSDPSPSSHDGYGQALAAGDFDGDGDTDLAVGSSATSVTIRKGPFTKSGSTGGTSTRSTAVQGNGHGVYDLAAGDVNGDGTADLAVGGMFTGFVYQSGPDGLALAATLNDGDQSDRRGFAFGDVTGDGYDDFVFGDPYDLNDSPEGGGSVSLYRGGADGISADPDQHVDQGTAGVPGADEYEDAFGGAVSVGDIDGDGYADVAVGSSDESIGAAATTGQVLVLKGAPAGLATSGIQVVHQNTSGVPDTNDDLDRFGWAVSLTDVNADGHADLFVGAQHENAGNGALWYLKGRSSGITTSGAVSYGPSTVGVSTAGTPAFGSGLTD
ncbi:FG-GAP-like repeat-containing protein [Streptomyces sp. NPDC050264]|uniref:FG-GAP-like repeat-containing protein n=1 Tax=Streptomyces sp. NPDC050264 TaxID=3155038 RepID=UPI00342D83B7